MEGTPILFFESCRGDTRRRCLQARCVVAVFLSLLTAAVLAGPAGAVTVASGDTHTCGVARGGDLFCWGSNTAGQLGDGTTTTRNGPVKIAAPADVTALAAGGAHTCALVVNGTISCWGANANGQLGNGSTTPSPTPVSVSGITDAVQIAAGTSHTCALRSDGSIFCWGDNTNGRLGDGSTTQRTFPVAVSGITEATSLSVGDSHACAVEAGIVKCWGLGTSGQLGDGATASSTTPVGVAGISGAQQAVAAGAHSCARVAGAVKCWGLNTNGQLGDGTTTSPRLAPVTAGSLTGVSQLVAGGSHTCAADATPQVTCWGLNTNGQLGDNSTTQHPSPTVVSGLTSLLAFSAGSNYNCAIAYTGAFKCWGAGAAGQIGDDGGVQRLVAATVPRLGGGRAIAGGQSHTCTALSAGGSWCWGINGAGQLGDGSLSTRPLPTHNYFANDAFAVAAGQTHTCVVVAGGQAKCWGSDGSGQLGDDATLASKSLAVSVSGMSAAVRIAAGNTHTCAVVSGGQAKCWGSDGNTQLGDDAAPTNMPTPVNVSGLTNAIEISAGGTTSCAIVSGGQAKCWGNNSLGQIGNGNETNQSSPTNVTGVTNAIAIANGLSHTCAIISGGTVKCWGNNSNGQLGNNSTTSSNVPVNVTGISGAISIEAGDYFTCAVVALGAVKCWGAGNLGQLGNGLNTQSLVPVDVTGLLGVTTVAAGQNHACAIEAHGRQTCWGYGLNYQLGNGSTANRSTPFEIELMLEAIVRFESIREGEFIQDPQPSISFTTADVLGPMLECNLDGAGWSNCTSPYTPGSPLALGRHSLQVRASGTDFVDGPISVSSLSFDVAVELPSVSIDSPSSGAQVNTATPSIAFTAGGQGALTTTCQIDSGAFGPCSSPHATPTMTEGAHTVTVKVTDAALNVATASVGLTVDTIAPNTTINANPPSLVSSAAASFSFSATEAATFYCDLDSGGWGLCVSPKTYSSLADGAHTFSVRATDTAGNVDASPASYAWTVDTLAPDTTIGSGPATLTNATSANFSFSAGETATFACNLDGAGWSGCTSPKAYASLAAGVHSFQVRATDTAGNVDATPASYAWTIDLTLPDTSITANPPISTNSAAASFSFSATETATFACNLDSVGWSGCTSPKAYASLAAGAHSFQVRATDTAGNVDATPASYAWTIDMTPPDTSITANPPTSSSSTAASFSFSATESAIFSCDLDGGGWGSCSSPKAYAALSDGLHSFQVRATDTAGNTDATPATHSWTVDTVAPSVAISSPVGGALLTSTPSVVFTVTEAHPGATTCSIDGGVASSCSSPFATGLAEGSHGVTVQHFDQAGNTGSASVSFTLDWTAPNTSFSATPPNPSSSAGATFSFTSSEGPSTFQCRLDVGTWGACTSPKSYAALGEGGHTVQVFATDQAGNDDVTPASYSWTIDTIAPVVTIASPVNGSTTGDGTPNAVFSVSDAGSVTVQCRVDAGVWQACASPYTASTLVDGAHSFNISATDAVGNLGSASVSFTVDSTFPTVAITAPAAAVLIADATPLVSFNATGSSITSECKIDAGAFAACASGSSSATLADGAHTLTVRVTDSPLARVATDSVSFTTDATAPVVSITSPAAGATLATLTPSIQFAASDASSVVLDCAVDGGAFATCASPLALTLTAGAHSVSVRATDAVGNQGVQAVSFTLAPPSPPISAPPSAPPAATPAPPATTGPVPYTALMAAKQSKRKLKLTLMLTPPAGVAAGCTGAVAISGKLRKTKVKVSLSPTTTAGRCVAAKSLKLKPGTRGKLKLTATFAGSSGISAFTVTKVVKIK